MLERIRLFLLNLFQPVYLDITAADIEQGNDERYMRCPATVAAQRIFRPDSFAGVSHISVYLPKMSKRETLYDGGEALRQFTTDFDNFRPVQPTRIKLKREPVHFVDLATF